MADTRTRTNRFEIEWRYAHDCWVALGESTGIPPVPVCSIWETKEGQPERFSRTAPIRPQMVTRNGTIVFPRA